MEARNRTTTALWTLLAAAIVGAQTACAQPPSFPDLSKFTEIAQDSPVFTTNRTGGHDATFSTPDGLHCTAAVHGQSCESAKVGEMPGFPSNARHLDLSPCGPASESVNSDDSRSEFVYTRNCEGTAASPVLQTGQKVTVVDMVTCKMGDYHIPNCTPGVHGTATCAVGTDRLTACTNGTHGFVLQPSGSWTF
jgi:hypothetical protein